MDCIMGYMSKESWFDAWLVKNTLLFFKTFKLVLGATHPPTQMIVLGGGYIVELNTHTYPVPRLRMHKDGILYSVFFKKLLVNIADKLCS